ncbi:MAG: hypothetical protein J6W02_06580 [Bacteroidaceae bacterium]|nr:hypothetical protein [Bacteroidaceae bacterium]
MKPSPTQTLHRHNTNAAPSRRKRCTVTTQTLHHHDESVAPLLGKAFHCTDTTHPFVSLECS